MWRPTTPQGVLIAVGVALAVLFVFTATGAWVYAAIVASIGIGLYLTYTIGSGLHTRFRDWLAGR